jgi:tol-pal system beta propeller repeat protein TolB
MNELHERFRELDRLDAPEVWPEVARRGPRPPIDLGPSPRRRVGIALLAFLIAASGLTFAARAFRSDQGQPLTSSTTVSNGKIAFARLGDNGWQIDTINPDGTAAATLVDTPDNAFHPAWSPDGHRILFDVQSSGGRMQIFVANDDGTGLTQLTDGPGWNYLPAWSSDGSKIAFVSTRDGNDEIYVMNADGSAQTRLTDAPNEDLSPSWAPGGDRIVFQSDRDGGNEIYVMNPDGTDVTRLTHDHAFDGAPIWSPDGDRIVFASDRDGPGLYTMNTNGTDIVQLTHDRQVGPLDPEWSPDGRSIVYTTSVNDAHQLRIFVVDVGTGSSQGIPGLVGDDICCPSWQPLLGERVAPSASEATPNLLTPEQANGAIYYRVAAADGTGEIDAVEVDGTAPRVAFAPGSPLSQGHIAWSSDGRRIAFDGYFGDHVGISIADSDGSAITSITSAPNDVWPSWSPDGSMIVFASTRYDPSIQACPTGIDLRCPTDIYVMNADGSDITRVTTDPAPEWNPEWSPDGTQIAFVKGESEVEIFVMKANGSDVRKLTSTDGGSGFDPSWSPDGTKIVFGSIQFEDWGIFIVNADGTNEHPLLFDNSIYATVPEWSPDGSLIAFQGSVGDETGVFAIRPDGSGISNLASDAHARGSSDGGIAWQPIPVDSQDTNSPQVSG